MTNLLDKRGANRAPKVECQKCHKEFTLGVNGTVDGCDACCGTERAVNGYVINEESEESDDERKA